MYAAAQPNKSLDASGISGLVIDISSVTQLLPAASTQSFARIALWKQAHKQVRQ